MQIGTLSSASGVSAKMIRYYEETGLIPAADRRESGYRDYGDNDLHRLRFVQRARELGFSMDQLRQLLRLWNDTNRPSREVKAVALEHIAELEEKARKLQGFADTLRALADSCDGDERSNCPILVDLSGGGHCHK